MLSANTLITLVQAMQLVALAPCLFVITFLLLRIRQRSGILVPILYFLALASAFLLPLMAILPGWDMHEDPWRATYATLLFVQTLLPALSFLLIMQIILGRIPPPLYWLVLAMPLLGGSPIVYASMLVNELCIEHIGCLSAEAIQRLYATFGTAALFMLLIVEFSYSKSLQKIAADDINQKNKYWLVLALIFLNLVLLAVDLVQLSGRLKVNDALFISTVVRMSFIYLVLTLLFRLFDKPASLKVVAQAGMTEREREISMAFIDLMEKEKIYREPECSRELVAARLGINENSLSRVINLAFEKRLTDIVNHYRVEEAKELLTGKPDDAVTHIAFDVGFNSIPSFNRVFKEGAGVSPTEYRNQHKQ